MLQSRFQEGENQRFGPGYNGGTGRKSLDFPTSPHAVNLPDVTDTVNKLLAEILDDVRNTLGSEYILKHKRRSHRYPSRLASPKALAYFRDNLRTGRRFDTKFHPDLPGRDKDGEVQYALYKGKPVSANYISNNIYGQLMAAMGVPLSLARLAGKAYSRGAGDLLALRRPSLETIRFQDPPEDQETIVSGYLDYFENDPWKPFEMRKPLRQGFRKFIVQIDPSRPHPEVYRERRHKTPSLTPVFEVTA